jgi:hypothetical protein
MELIYLLAGEKSGKIIRWSVKTPTIWEVGNFRKGLFLESNFLVHTIAERLLFGISAPA